MLTASDTNLESSKLLAWCSNETNQINVVDIELHKEFSRFEGVRLRSINRKFSSQNSILLTRKKKQKMITSTPKPI